jgi:hypothetical protein
VRNFVNMVKNFPVLQKVENVFSDYRLVDMNSTLRGISKRLVTSTSNLLRKWTQDSILEPSNLTTFLKVMYARVWPYWLNILSAKGDESGLSFSRPQKENDTLSQYFK